MCFFQIFSTTKSGEYHKLDTQRLNVFCSQDCETVGRGEGSDFKALHPGVGSDQGSGDPFWGEDEIWCKSVEYCMKFGLVL